MENNVSGYHVLNQRIAQNNQRDVKWIPKKDDTSRIVRIPSCQKAYKDYLSHSYFDEQFSVPPFACIKEKDAQAEDPYDKAAKYLESRTRPRINEGLYGRGNEDPEYTIEKRLKARPRIMFGFYNVNDGQPFVVDMSEKQADVIAKELSAKSKHFGTRAFELRKVDKTYSIQPYIDDLTTEQQQHFNACSEPFDHNLFAGALFFRSEEKQIEDLHEIGIDVTALGYSVPTKKVVPNVPTSEAPANTHQTTPSPSTEGEKQTTSTNDTVAFTIPTTDMPENTVHNSDELEEIMGESETA